MIDAAWLIPAFPVAGFVLLVLFGRRLGEPVAGWLATLASAGAFVSTVIVFFGLQGMALGLMLGLPVAALVAYRARKQQLWFD